VSLNHRSSIAQRLSALAYPNEEYGFANAAKPYKDCALGRFASFDSGKRYLGSI
jgi:hypothetical protein